MKVDMPLKKETKHWYINDYSHPSYFIDCCMVSLGMYHSIKETLIQVYVICIYTETHIAFVYNY